MTFIRASISHLLLRSSPSDITRLVTSVIVDAVKRCAAVLWLGSDVRDESVEAVSPLSAHGDPAPAVVLEIPYTRILAAIFGVLPRFVFRCCVTTLRISVAKSRLCRSEPQCMFSGRAAARKGTAGAKMATACDGVSAAIAATLPATFTRRWFWRHGVQHQQSPESLSGHVDLVASLNLIPSHVNILTHSQYSAGS